MKNFKIVLKCVKWFQRVKIKLKASEACLLSYGKAFRFVLDSCNIHLYHSMFAWFREVEKTRKRIFFAFRSSNVLKLYAKRPKFKTPRLKACARDYWATLPKWRWLSLWLIVARINPEINIMLSGQVVEGNLSPDSRWSRITEFIVPSSEQSSTYQNHERSLFGCFQGYDDYGNWFHISGRKVMHRWSKTTATKCFHFTLCLDTQQPGSAFNTSDLHGSLKLF